MKLKILLIFGALILGAQIHAAKTLTVSADVPACHITESQAYHSAVYQVSQEMSDICVAKMMYPDPIVVKVKPSSCNGSLVTASFVCKMPHWVHDCPHCGF